MKKKKVKEARKSELSPNEGRDPFNAREKEAAEAIFSSARKDGKDSGGKEYKKGGRLSLSSKWFSVQGGEETRRSYLVSKVDTGRRKEGGVCASRESPH